MIMGNLNLVIYLHGTHLNGGAFVRQFDDYMARSYYIDGLRGEVKKISLPHNLVVWE